MKRIWLFMHRKEAMLPISQKPQKYLMCSIIIDTKENLFIFRLTEICFAEQNCLGQPACAGRRGSYCGWCGGPVPGGSPSITKQTEDVEAAAGDTVSVHLEANRTDASCQWQSSSNRTTWKICTSVGSSTDPFSFLMKDTLNRKKYSCAVYGAGQSVTSNIATVTVPPAGGGEDCLSVCAVFCFLCLFWELTHGCWEDWIQRVLNQIAQEGDLVQI